MLKHDLALVIVGVRRAGKSTSLEHLQTVLKERGVDKRHILYITFDRLRAREQIDSDDTALKRLIEEQAGQRLEKLDRKFYCIMDEAQKAPAVFEQVKIIYDQMRQNVQFLFSGSSSLHIQDKTAESLGGRLRYIHVYPFSLRERLVAKGIISPSETACLHQLLDGRLNYDHLRDMELKFAPIKDVISSVVEESLIWGSFPEMEKYKTTEDKIGYLDGYKETYLDKDIRSLDHVGDLKDFANCLTAVAATDGHLLAPTKLAADIGIHYLTLKRYLSILNATGIQMELPPYIENARKRLIKAAKSYMVDLGLVSYLTQFFDTDAMKKSGVIGHRFENYIITEISKYAALQIPRANLYFWRTSGGVEVDCVYKNLNSLIPIEIKYSPKTDKRWLDHLGIFMKDYGDHVRYGAIIYNGHASLDPQTNIFFVPANLLF